jgi:phage-related protein
MRMTILFILAVVGVVFAVDTNTVKHAGDVVGAVVPAAKPFIDLLTTAIVAVWSLVLYIIAHRHGLASANRILKNNKP